MKVNINNFNPLLIFNHIFIADFKECYQSFSYIQIFICLKFINKIGYEVAGIPKLGIVKTATYCKIGGFIY